MEEISGTARQAEPRTFCLGSHLQMQIQGPLSARRVQFSRRQTEALNGNLKQAALQIFFSEFHLPTSTLELPWELAGRS
jgi:hypothetical protein